jgi:thiol-disulfide isomerase/thioredoxin
MKRSVIHLLLLMLLSFSAYSENIPARLQGLWLIDGTSKGEWDAITVTENHVEFWYDMYKVDSIVAQTNGTKVYITSKAGKKTSVVIQLNADSIAKFKFNEWDIARTCRLVARHPDMVYYEPEKTQATLQGEWIIGRNPKTVASVSNNKIFLDDKHWDIIWFGRYLDLEYRALLRFEDTYRLVYVKRNGQMLSIGGDGKSQGYALKAKNEGVYEVFGNWYEPVANKWTFGFLEEFAIYNGAFWDYEVLKFSGKSGNAVLKNGKRRVELKLTKLSDTTLSVESGDKKVRQYKLAAKALPAFQVEDKLTFKNTHFEKVDTAYIMGYMRNKPNNEPVAIGYYNIINGQNEKAYGDVDQFGRFLVKVPLLNTSVVTIILATGSTFDVVEPGERYLLSYDFASKQHLVMGSNDRLHNELANYSPYGAFQFGDHRNQVRKLKPLDFLAAKRTELGKANGYVLRYFNTTPKLSERAKYFIESFNKYTIGTDLMQKRFDLDRQSKELFPDEYMAYVKDSLMTSPPVPFTISPGISTFLRDYLQYHQQFDSSVGVVHQDVFLSMINDGRIKVADEEKQALILVGGIDHISAVDSVRGKALRDSIGVEKIKLFNRIRSQHQASIDEAATDLLWQNVLNQQMTSYETNLPNEDLRKTFQAAAIYECLERTRKALEPKTFASLIKKIKSPAIEESLIKYQNFLLKVPNQDFVYAESLKNTNHLKGTKNADSLFNALLLPYKGKVVYLDFWGTWCPPCREEMKYVGATKAALKDKDVIFMYFANNSPETSWKNMIKELNLTGQNVVHYRLPIEQQYLIENRLSIEAFPTYMLVNKSGKIVNTKAPRPSNPTQLVKAIDVLLAE